MVFPAEINNRRGSHLEGRSDSFIFGPVEFKSPVGNLDFLEDKIPIFHSVSITASLFYSSAATSIAIFSTVFLHKCMRFRISSAFPAWVKSSAIVADIVNILMGGSIITFK